jgi:hypothetical protein
MVEGSSLAGDRQAVPASGMPYVATTWNNIKTNKLITRLVEHIYYPKPAVGTSLHKTYYLSSPLGLTRLVLFFTIFFSFYLSSLFD